MDVASILSRLPIRRFREPPPVVAVLRLSGIIGSLGPLRTGLSLASLADSIERAFKLHRLKAVALSVNSPGGSAVQSALIAQRIRDLAKEKEVRIFAFAEDVAASGGYWLLCTGDEVYAHESSIIGSIGVISAGFGFQDLLRRFGIERRIHTSGDKKSMLDPFKDEDPQDVERLRAIQQEIHESFKSTVRERREKRLNASEQTLFNGEFWTGRKALELGLIDGLGELRHVMRQRFGDKVILKRIGVARPWWRRRLLRSDLPQPTDLFAGLITAAEERALWARYGL
jgi:signal peptide peptidase SppA